MKTQLILAAALLASTTVSAQSNSYFSKDNKIESKLCVLSANEGFSAARKEASQHGVFLSRFSQSILCNGEDIRDIAKKGTTTEVIKTKVEVFAKDTQQETQLCMTALKQGLAPVRQKIGNLNSLKCNGQKVTDFVKRYQNAAI
ncbi:exonuclease III [Pseudoalteromonas fuliginea]|uniref:Exonuclease III n=1 Tax=Pseudoalteromonas fuliginea TaxID=1872678 RepID=A0ABQ6RHQ5_9GAMM|nr:exonuclease III [Pseudoalteromonas fuliginea]KAA1155992.1 exonuclease III [Pseudoalteromonas fuliginea]KAA1167231.1 exonuclease III [Pseudoalteromonas fuliginea]